MKDGRYRVTVIVDGKPESVEAVVRDGVLYGTGAFAHLRGTVVRPDRTQAALEVMQKVDMLRQEVREMRRRLSQFDSDCVRNQDDCLEIREFTDRARAELVGRTTLQRTAATDD